MAPNLAADLERIAGSDLIALRQRWRRVYGRAPPAGIPRVLLAISAYSGSYPAALK